MENLCTSEINLLETKSNMVEFVKSVGDLFLLVVLAFSIGSLLNFTDDANEYRKKVSNFILGLGCSLVILTVKSIIFNKP